MKQLFRSRRKKVLFGLCGGLSDYFNVDANLLRILTIILAVCTSGAAIAIYILAALVIPKEHDYNQFPPGNFGSYQDGRGGDFYGGHNDPGRSSTGFGQGIGGVQHGGPYRNPPQNQEGPTSAGWQSDSNRQADLDKMMDELEKKALRNELEELKAKLSKYEKGE